MSPILKNLLERLQMHVNLGHAKRNASFLRQVALACTAPGISLAQGAGGRSHRPMSDLASFYRFTRNDELTLAQLRQARLQTVLNGLAPGQDVLAVHDVTLLDYSRHHRKADRRPIGDHRGQGYECHCVAAVEPHAGTTLGVLHDTLVNQHGPDDRDVMDYDYDPLFADFCPEEQQRLKENHRHQMAVHIRGLASALSSVRVIHVADIEFDDIFILRQAVRDGQDFVIRSSGKRNVQVLEESWLPESVKTPKQRGHQTPEGWVCVDLHKLAFALPLTFYKKLPLDKNGRVTDEDSAARVAELSIGTCRVRLYRDAKRNKKYFHTDEAVEVDFVVIHELEPPAGVAALCWMLLTSLPVQTLDQQQWVGLIYERRFSIERLFRLLKSGYQIEKLRLDNADKIARAMVVLTLAAMLVLNLKHQLGLPATGTLSEDNHRRITQAMHQPTNPEIPLQLRLFAFILRKGAWLGRKRDPIGPMALMRGTLKLLAIFDAFDEHRELIEEGLRNPEIISSVFEYAYNS